MAALASRELVQTVMFTANERKPLVSFTPLASRAFSWGLNSVLLRLYCRRFGEEVIHISLGLDRGSWESTQEGKSARLMWSSGPEKCIRGRSTYHGNWKPMQFHLLFNGLFEEKANWVQKIACNFLLKDFVLIFFFTVVELCPTPDFSCYFLFAFLLNAAIFWPLFPLVLV